MLLPLAAVLVAVASSQVGGRDPALPDDGTGPRPPGAADPAADFDQRFAEPPQAGIPFQQYATVPPRRPSGFSIDAGVGTAARARTLAAPGDTTIWATDIEVTPGASLSLDLPAFHGAAGYAARLTFPLASSGSTLAVLNQGYLRAQWQPGALWVLTVEASGIVGDNSQLIPAATPGAPGPTPPSIDPVRTFTTYPYLNLIGTLRAATQLSHRSRLRLAVGYFDIGGTGTQGALAQPRTWGPTADCAWEWQVSPTGALTTSANVVDSILIDDAHILLATLRETWAHRWTPDLETTLSGGVATSNTDSNTFLTVSHVLPVAGVGLRYFTDARHQFRLAFDAALAPYVDTYIRASYQRVTGTLALDWYPTAELFLGVYASAAWVPYSVQAPESYGTAGLAANWAPTPFLTLGAGGFGLSQFQGQPVGGGAFRQWTGYLSVTLREKWAL